MSMRSYVSLKPRLLGEASVASLAETFRALGDTTRVRLLDALSRAELCVQDLADLLSLTQSAVSHQLRLLRAMRLVRTRRDGRLIYYALDDDHIVKLFEQGLEHVEERTPTNALRRSVADARESAPRASARDSLEPLRGAKPSSNRGGGGVPAAIGNSPEPLRGAKPPSNRGRGGAPAAIGKGGAPRETRKR